MTRRGLLLATTLLPFRMMAAEQSIPLRGRLRQGEDSKPGIITREGKSIDVSGDAATLGVLRDQRLKDADFEAMGHFTGPAQFEADPIYKKALFAWSGGKRLMVTYWCEICSIRAWTPGNCQCCQRPMKLDLRDPALEDTDPTN
ncbi:MAG: hypothetical protein J0H49_20850 [Acidobacteria bacterium]|nr:hypothetical protein [Acidobacteriota bacterium]